MKRKTDRRTVYTLRVIKDSFLKLINQKVIRKLLFLNYAEKLILPVQLSTFTTIR